MLQSSAKEAPPDSEAAWKVEYEARSPVSAKRTALCVLRRISTSERGERALDADAFTLHCSS